MYKLKEVNISKVIEVGKDISCIADRYVVCKVLEEFTTNSAVFEVGDLIICTYNNEKFINITPFDDFQNTKMSDFLTNTTSYSTYTIMINSIDIFKRRFKVLDNETEKLELFISKIKEHKNSLNATKDNINNITEHYNNVEVTRQCIIGMASSLIFIMVFAFINKYDYIINNIPLIVKILIVVIEFILSIGGLILTLSSIEHVLIIHINKRPLLELEKEKYNKELKMYCNELEAIRQNNYCVKENNYGYKRNQCQSNS